MTKKSTALQDRIEQAAQRLATLKARQQAALARERLRETSAARRARNRALVLWGVAMERQMLMEPAAAAVIHQLLSKHLVRMNEREAALTHLANIKGGASEQSA